MRKADGRTLLQRACLIITLLLLYAASVRAADPGTTVSSAALLGDQKPGSVLFYNLYKSSGTNPGAEDTELNLINTHATAAVTVRLFLVQDDTGEVRSEVFCLGPNQVISLLASQLHPGGAGYAVAVAVDGATGCPVSHNFLLGDAYVRLADGYFARLNAVSLAANFAGRAPSCNAGANVANLVFDGSPAGYNRVPRALSLNNFPSRGGGNDTLLVLNRVGGNLTTRTNTVGAVAGTLFDDATNEFGFSFNANSAQFRSALTNNFPRLTLPLETIVTADRSGWLKLWTQNDDGLLGAALNFNPNAATSALAFTTGHNLVTLTLATTSSYVIPVSPQECANRPLLASLSPGSASATTPGLTLTVRGLGFVNGARVQWNGAARATTFVSDKQLTASITAADLSGGPGTVTVVNTPGGPPSNALRFSVGGSACVYTLSATSQAFGASGGSGSITVTTGSGCAWSVSTNENWITINSPRNNTGSGPVNFSVAPNTSALARTSALSVAGQNFSVTQAGTASASGDLAVDDGSYELSVGYPSPGVPSTSYFVNRLTPNSYPATLTAVVIYLPKNFSGLVPGQRLGIISAANLSGNENIDRLPLQIEDGFIQTLDAFNVFPVRPLTISAGDFVVGFQISPRDQAFPAVVDRTPPLRRRSYVSTGGSAFALLDSFGADLAGNFGIRARLAATSSNPVPMLANITPNAANPGGPGFTLTVNGTGFITTSTVRWNGNDRATTFVSTTRLSAQIPAADVAGVGTASVTVFNPTPGGGVSNTLSFTLAQPDAGPLAEQEPNETLEQATPLALPGSRTGNAASDDASVNVIVRADGTRDGLEDFFVITLPRPMRLTLSLSVNSDLADLDLFLYGDGGNRLIAASNRAGPGNERITFNNTLEAGRYHVAVSAFLGGADYTLAAFSPDIPGNPPPAITQMHPTSARANGAGFALTVIGENFVNGSVVRWNGKDRATIFINENELSATIPAADLATPGRAAVTVFNPAPGGGVSNTLNFTITPALQAVPPRATKDATSSPARVPSRATPNSSTTLRRP